MLKFIANVIVACYYASFFVLGFIYALPVLQAKLRVKQESVFKAILITIAYHIFVVTVLYLLSRRGLYESISDWYDRHKGVRNSAQYK